VWFRISTSMGGIWIIVELITSGRGVPLILYIINVILILFDLVLILGWMLLTEKINNMPYISMTMSKEFESIREEDERLNRQIKTFQSPFIEKDKALFAEKER